MKNSCTSVVYAVQTPLPLIRQPQGLTPSPTVREKADKFVCASSLFSEYCLGYNLLLVKLEYFIEKVCDNSIKSVK